MPTPTDQNILFMIMVYFPCMETGNTRRDISCGSDPGRRWVRAFGRFAMSVTDTLHFLRTWLRNPLRVGAVAPSGSALARLITADIDAGRGPVIELGPGTGVFTHALLTRGVPAHRLALVEADPEFAGKLARRFPQARVLSMDAAQLGGTASLFDDGERASAVVSGLPLLSMPKDKVWAIVDGVFRQHLRAAALPAAPAGAGGRAHRSCDLQPAARLGLPHPAHRHGRNVLLSARSPGVRARSQRYPAACSSNSSA